MPRYLVQRTFPEGLELVVDRCRAIVDCNTEHEVTWITSFITDNGSRSFCVYDAPSPEAIRRTAARNQLPVDQIVQVRVLDPYSYSCAKPQPSSE